ncbi:MAG: hypothetical protein ACYCSN_06980 [Acidobacteriaceae bacterium]
MATRSDEPDVNVEYFQVLEDGKGLHTYGELPLMAISYLADPSRRVLQGIVIKEGAWVVSRIFTEEQARRVLADDLRRVARHALNFPNSPRAFLVVEGERELGVTASLYEAAILWKENPDARTVFQVTPPDGSGAGRWERTSGVSVDALRAELPS